MSALPEASFGERLADATYVPRPSAYAVIVRNGAVLLVQGSNGGWFFPGGGVEPGEAHEGGLVREILEETGCRGTVSEAFAEALQHLYAHDERTHFELHATYHAASIEESGSASGEHRSEWVPTARAMSLLRREADRWGLQTYLRLYRR